MKSHLTPDDLTARLSARQRPFATQQCRAARFPGRRWEHTVTAIASNAGPASNTVLLLHDAAIAILSQPFMLQQMNDTFRTGEEPGKDTILSYLSKLSLYIL
jgi:hypothetical protein